MEANIIISHSLYCTMIHRPLSSYLIHPQNALSNPNHLPDKPHSDKSNPKLYPSLKEPKPKPTQECTTHDPHLSNNNNQLHEETCFKCKKVGQLFCCDNCFRSFHWKCIGSKKIQELTKMTHTINFICESCDLYNHCTKCYSTHPLKNNFSLIDYSDHNSVLAFYKCTHCYSKIHKKCYDVPYDALEKGGLDAKESDSMPHYVCVKCLENVGITEVIRTQRLSLQFGIQKLYFLVLLNTNSPLHQGWFEEITLSQHIKKFTDNQTCIDDFLKDKSLYQLPQIDKIIEIKFPKKHKHTSISDVLKIIESKSRMPIQERYGSPDNFKFLVKWKNRNYTGLSWEDEPVVMRGNVGEVRKFLAEREKWKCMMQMIGQCKSARGQENSAKEVNYKILEYELTSKPQIQQKYVQSNKQIDPFNKAQHKPFEQRMHSLDAENAKEAFIELIEIEGSKTSIKSPFEYMQKLVAYFQKCYLSEILLRPILIVSEEGKEWEEALKGQKRFREHYVRYQRFTGGKENVRVIKKWDFFVSEYPCILRFDVLVMDFNYFIYEKEYIFKSIPSFFAILIDKSPAYSSEQQKLNFLTSHYLPFKSKVHKQMYIIDSSSLTTSTDQLASSILHATESTPFPIKKSLTHTLDFTKSIRFNSSQPKLKLIIAQILADNHTLLSLNYQHSLNQAQRISYLKFILSYGLNVKAIPDICVRLKEMNPIVWNVVSEQHMKLMVQKYTPLFISIISKNSIKPQSPIDPTVIHHFLFHYDPSFVFKRIIQLKKLKTLIEIHSDDRSKFPISNLFQFFAIGKVKQFPLWSVYEDYTLGALIIEEGYQRWDKLINSEKWKIYHEQLEKKKFFQFDSKQSVFMVRQQIVAIKKKPRNDLTSESQQQQLNDSRQVKSNSTSNINQKQSEQSKIKSYGEYLINKIRNSKQIEESEYKRLFDIKVLQGHIAERGHSIVSQMNDTRLAGG